VVPFITEALWRRLPATDVASSEFIATAPWPVIDTSFAEEREFELVREAIIALRQLRSEYSIPPGDIIAAEMMPLDTGAGTASTSARFFREEEQLFKRLARCELSNTEKSSAGTASNVVSSDGDTADSKTGAMILLRDGMRLFVPLAGVIDVQKECTKARNELDRLEKQLASLSARLDNSGFTSRAPAEVVESERRKHAEWSGRRVQLSEKVRALCGS
jgi:valyl-tRNA synthetase